MPPSARHDRYARNGTMAYFERIGAFKPMSRSEEQSLFALWKQTRKDRYRNEFISRYLRLSVKIAMQYRRYGVDLDDLIAVGNLGLVHALGKFEPERGNRFLTYANYWVRAYVLRYILTNLSIVGGNVRSGDFFRLRRRYRSLLLQMSDHDAVEAMAEEEGRDSLTMATLLNRLISTDRSLDEGFDDSGATRRDFLPDCGPDPEEQAAENEHARLAHERLDRAIAQLDRRETEMARLRLSYGPGDAPTLADMGRRWGVSRERARQIETRTKSKLRARLLVWRGDLTE